MADELKDREWLSAPQAARYLGCSEATIYRLTKAGKLIVHGLGGLRRYRREELDAAMKPLDEGEPPETP